MGSPQRSELASWLLMNDSLIFTSVSYSLIAELSNVEVELYCHECAIVQN